jgi:hypothetical protein
MEIKLLIIIIIFIGLGIIGSYYYYNNFIKPTGPVLNEPNPTGNTTILFLHHSTGNNIWNGGVKEWFTNYNTTHDTNYTIIEQSFPKRSPYGWHNYPYDYWNIWVNHAGDQPYKEEPTLEMITKTYDVIIWKHCFPVSNIKEDTGNPSITSSEKRLENYKLQYNALKQKMKEFPETKFIVWTPSALVEPATSKASAERTQEFYNWIKNDWNEPKDNIFLWDFYILETEGDLYLKPNNAAAPDNSHPSTNFSQTVAPYFCQRIIDVIEGRGDTTPITGKTEE